MQLGFFLELPGIAGSGKAMNGFFGFHSFVESLRAYIVVFALVNLPMHRRPGGSGGIHGTFLLFGHTGCFIRGDVRLSKRRCCAFPQPYQYPA